MSVGKFHLVKSKVALNTASTLIRKQAGCENERSEKKMYEKTSNEYGENRNDLCCAHSIVKVDSSCPLELTEASDEIKAQPTSYWYNFISSWVQNQNLQMT